VHNAASLHGRHAEVPHLRLGFHCCPAFFWMSGRAAVLTRGQRRRPFLSSFSWPLKVRVGANSPSLWPTIDSVMNTETCLRPSCTAKVWPRKSGVMTERRDQGLMRFLVPFSFWASSLFCRWSSTKGPLAILRGIVSDPPYQRFLPDRRRRTMSLSLSLPGRRVRPSG